MPFAELRYEDFEFFEKLGCGSFGSVYRARWKSQNKEVAIKKLLSLGEEADVLGVLSHKHIIQFYGAVISKPNFCLITEYAKHGSLHEYLTQNELDVHQILNWAKQIGCGISYLHNEAPFKIIHRDLKSKNIVITADMLVKLCDFGSSRYLDQTTKMSMAGTFPWMAPEVIQSMPVSETCDTFSYGIVIWEMLTREVPWQGMEGVQVAWLVVAKEERLTIPTSCPPAFGKLLKSCWMTDPKQRPNFKEIQNVLNTMCLDNSLVEETNSFIKNKGDWKNEIDMTVKRLKTMERHLSSKEQELLEREMRLLRKEYQLDVVKMLNKTDLKEWDVGDVSVWMEQIGNEAVDLLPYAQVFYDNHITGRRLIMLTNEALKEMGILSYGHRMDLMDQVTKLKDELEHLTHFPPLEQAPVVEASGGNQKTAKLTLLFGNHCRLGPTPMDHKWKVYVEVDGEDEVLTAIKDVTLITTEDQIVLTHPPYVMNKWQISGDTNSPIFVECIVSYEGHIKKPRTTKHKHEVLIKEGGSVFQQTIELLMKPMESDEITSTVTDEGYSTPSSLSSNSHRLSSRLSSTSLKKLDVSSTLCNENNTVLSWANRVKGQSPKTFMPRLISDANKEVLLRNRELASSPLVFKRKLSQERTSPSLLYRPASDIEINTGRRISSTDSIDTLQEAVDGCTLKNTRGGTLTEGCTQHGWTVVKKPIRETKPSRTLSNSRGNNYRGNYQDTRYYRSQSDQANRKEGEVRKTKLNYSEGDKPSRGRGRGGTRGRGRGGFGQRGAHS